MVNHFVDCEYADRFERDMEQKYGEITLAEQLEEAGYRTAAFVANMQVSPEYGYQQGFQHFFATGVLKMRATVTNQRGELVLEGEHVYLVRTRAGATGPTGA